MRIPLSLLAFLVVALAGCDAAAPESAVTAEARPEFVPVCHYDETADTYSPIRVPAPALDGHLGHGDARVGALLEPLFDTAFDASCDVVSALEGTLDQITPISASYDNRPLRGTSTGEVIGPVIPVDINLGGDRANSSGCEPSDFEGLDFSGDSDVALIQRSGCLFGTSTANAIAAGAEAVVYFNQGNNEFRLGVIGGTLSAESPVGVPVTFTTFAAGEALATPGSTARVAVAAIDFATATATSAGRERGRSSM